MELFDAVPDDRAHDARTPHAKHFDEEQIDESGEKHRNPLLDFRDVPVVNAVEPAMFFENVVNKRQSLPNRVAGAVAAVENVRDSDARKSARERRAGDDADGLGGIRGRRVEFEQVADELRGGGGH